MWSLWLQGSGVHHRDVFSLARSLQGSGVQPAKYGSLARWRATSAPSSLRSPSGGTRRAVITRATNPSRVRARGRGLPVEVPVEDGLAPERGGDRSGGEERPEGHVVLAAAQAREDQAEADDGAVHEAEEQPEEHVAPAEPAQREPEHEREPHIAEAHAPRRDQVDGEEGEERDRGRGERAQPARRITVGERGDTEQYGTRDPERVHEPVRQQVVLEVDHRQGEQAGAEHQERG